MSVLPTARCSSLCQRRKELARANAHVRLALDGIGMRRGGDEVRLASYMWGGAWWARGPGQSGGG
ncbi:MAG: hypothetical protein AAGG69_01320, partial [Pseudomonadota bacterium]